MNTVTGKRLCRAVMLQRDVNLL